MCFVLDVGSRTWAVRDAGSRTQAGKPAGSRTEAGQDFRLKTSGRRIRYEMWDRDLRQKAGQDIASMIPGRQTWKRTNQGRRGRTKNCKDLYYLLPASLFNFSGHVRLRKTICPKGEVHGWIELQAVGTTKIHRGWKKLPQRFCSLNSQSAIRDSKSVLLLPSA